VLCAKRNNRQSSGIAIAHARVSMPRGAYYGKRAVGLAI
jgi:hypothetical protein